MSRQVPAAERVAPAPILRAAGVIALVTLLTSLLVPATTVRAANASVAIEDFAFTPGTLTLAVGDTVTWTNVDSAPHAATSEDGRVAVATR